MMNINRLISPFRSDQRGTAVLETAVILPVLLMIVLGFIDLTMGFTYHFKLQQYAQSGADMLVANFEDQLTDSEIKTEMASLTGLPQSAIEVTRIVECDHVAVNPDEGCASSGQVEINYITIVVTDTFEPILGNIGLTNYIGATRLRGKTTVRVR